jgi:uncharacterized spore protein YtfJ
VNFEDLLRISVSQLEKFLTTKTVVGDPIVIGDVTLVPIQTVSFGYGTGGGEGGDEKGKGTGGGGGAGANLKPIAVVAVKGTDVQVYTLGKKGVVDNIAALIPDAFSKVMACRGKKDEKGGKGDKGDGHEEGKE